MIIRILKAVWYVITLQWALCEACGQLYGSNANCEACWRWAGDDGEL